MVVCSNYKTEFPSKRGEDATRNGLTPTMRFLSHTIKIKYLAYSIITGIKFNRDPQTGNTDSYGFHENCI
jgi:hypothetical protein